MRLQITFLFLLFSFISLAQPINDSPCIGDANPPFNLGIGGLHTGTTCGAIGYNDDPSKDKKNIDCNSFTDDDAVWYITKLDSLKDGISINITKGTIGDGASVEIYVGDTNAICNGTANFLKSKCDGLPIINMHIGCIDTAEFIFIKIASTDNDCGTFTISVNGISDCDIADECEDLTSAQELNPITPDDVWINKVCTNGCLDLACPDSGLSEGCAGFDTQPTVWFQVNTDADAAQLYSYITTYGSWTPVWSVFYSPTNDCMDLVNAAGFGSFNCSLDAIPPAPPLITGVKEGTYYIAVSANTGNVIDDPDFEICVATIGSSNTECETIVSKFEVTERENTDAESGPPFIGPFCPGEQITVHLNFTYDATQTGDDWMIGMIPKFGNGWDMDGFDFEGNPPVGSPGGLGEYYREDGECPPLVTEDFSYLCTYKDAYGNLKLCNLQYESCPCSEGMKEGDTLPSGYFWVQEGGGPDCDSSNCSPSRKYGIGSPVSTIDWEIHLKVKEFSNQNNCIDSKDLSISFMTFSDGGAGCWDDPIGDCLVGKPQFSPKWEVNCDIPPSAVTTPPSRDICSGGVVDVDVTTDDGSTNIIEVTHSNNPNISGISNHSFPNGFGTIDDILTINNFACDSQIVYYFVKVITTDFNCKNSIDTIKVNVFPEPNLVKQDTILKLYPEDLPYQLNLDANCGYHNIYAFNWEEVMSGKAGVGDTIIIDSTFVKGLNTFNTTITDKLGCESIDDFYVYIIDTVSTIFEINSEKIDVSCYNECDGTIGISNVSNATYPLKYNWSNGDSTALINNLCSGEYSITITDANDKEGVDSFNITQPNEIIINVDAILNISPSSIGGIFITTNNNGNYKFKWIGPNDFTAATQNITNLNDPGCYTFVVTDTVTNCSQDTTICIEKTNSSEDLLAHLKSTYIIPNPNTGDFNLVLGEIAKNSLEIELFSNKGEMVFNNTYNSYDSIKSINFSFNELPSGIYFLKIISKDKIKVLKFVLR